MSSSHSYLDVANFTPWSALIGGIMIGLAASILMLGIGKIMGMSGILKSTLLNLPTIKLTSFKFTQLSWQLVFVLGMAVATWGYTLIFGFPELVMNQPLWKIILAGLLVGFGTRLGSGCTSGHGICGISRLSIRSITATLLFLSSGIVTATIFAMI